MKKIIAAALLCACLLAVPALSACSDGPCDHRWTETSHTDADCTHGGTIDWKCSVCGKTKQTTTEKTGHTPGTDFGHDENSHWNTCSVCSAKIDDTVAPHSGGKATLTDKAVCETCGTPYGDLISTDIIMKDFNPAASGGFSQNSDGISVASTQYNSLLIKRNGEFKLGVLSAVVSLSGTPSDNGIVFGVTNPENLTRFWEQDVSYYFFFVSRDGSAYLGKVTQGAWSALAVTAIPGFSHTGTYELKVERTDTATKCYVNNVQYIHYSEAIMLSGTGYGLRAGVPGVNYSELYCENTGDIPSYEEGNLRTVSGGTAGTDEFAIATKTETLAFLEKKATSGTFSLNVTSGGANAGLVFGMDDGGKNYYLLAIDPGAHVITLTRRKNGRSTPLYSNYLSASVNNGSQYELKITLSDGKVYAYFNNKAFNDTRYIVQDVELDGNNFGIYSSLPGAIFSDYSLDPSVEVKTCDTLFFGHSYFELWSDWKIDLASVEGLGVYENIGIGGSIAAHWNKMKDAVVSYRPKQIVYWIGINDLTGGASPTVIAGNVRTLLDELKTELPELKAVLLSTNYCNAREQFRAQIAETNDLYKRICAERDWVNYAEMLTAFCDTNDTPSAHWFKDGLHPSAEGYRQKVIPAVISAMKGENQPALSPGEIAAALAEAKAVKKCALDGFDENAYDPDHRDAAKTIYDGAVAEIDACTTTAEVNALDLSEYMTELEKLPRRSQAFFDAMKSGVDCEKFENANFTAVINSSTDGKLILNDFGHRLFGGINAADLSFTFRLSDLVGECGIGGILFRAKRDGGNGVCGYLINYVTKENYIQIWYCDGAYGGSKNILHYIGGWVFPGEVEETLFRATVENDCVYIYTQADYLRLGRKGYGCSVPLNGSNMNLNLPVFGAGALGVVNWQDGGVTYSLEINTLSYEQTNESAANDISRTYAVEPRKKYSL